MSKPVEYRPVKDFPGYRVGSDGSVWSCWCHSRWFTYQRHIYRRMKASRRKDRASGRSYPYLNLSRDGVAHSFKVHTLILETFVGPCPDGLEARHLDGDPANNALRNLCWGTPEQNREDNRRLGRYGRGETHTQAKLTEGDVRAIRRRRDGGEPLAAIAADFGVNVPSISGIVNRRTWKHVV